MIASCSVAETSFAPLVETTITVTTTGDGTVTASSGDLSCSGATCSGTFPDGSTVSLTATPGAGWVFTGWTGACSGAGACSISVAGAGELQVGATFSTSMLTVSFEGDATGEVVSDPPGIVCGSTCTAPFPPGTIVTLTATATEVSSIFGGWSDPQCPGAEPCMIALSDPTTSIAATFRKIRTATFTASGSFTVPAGITSVRVFAIGGGGGGANGHQGGGGSGVVAAGTFGVVPATQIAVTVGAGGAGALGCQCPGNEIVGNTPGGASSFGALLSAAGGSTSTMINAPGAPGGSGGGGACNAGSPGGAGGTAGAAGASCTFVGGMGQGASFAASLAGFTEHTLTAGAGGAGGTSSHAGGGGGGGVLLDSTGPSGQDGAAAFSAKGGIGHGGGGGAGGYNAANEPTRFGGGAGAAGLVYIEW